MQYKLNDIYLYKNQISFKIKIQKKFLSSVRLKIVEINTPILNDITHNIKQYAKAT